MVTDAGRGERGPALGEGTEAVGELLAAAPGPMVALREGRIAAVNAFATDHLGVTAARLTGQRLEDWLVGDPVWDGRTASGPATLVDRMGAPVEVRARSLSTANGPVVLVGWRRVDDQPDRDLEGRLVSLVQSSDDAILSKDTTGVITSWNAAAERLYGYSPSEVIGKPVSIIIPPDRAGEEYVILDQILRGDQVDHYETERITKHGERVEVSLTVSPLRNRSGEVVGASTIAREIGHRKEGERRRARQAQELERSNVELQRYAYVASHDLQEPLRMVVTYTDLLAESLGDRLEPDLAEAMEYIVDGVERMQAIIEGLLAYSRVRAEDTKPRPVELGPVVDRAVADLRTTIRDTGATITYEDLPTVSGDPLQLSQVFQNLISNALKFRSSDAPEVVVSAQREGEEWVVSVRDNGIGIDPRFADKVFGLFRRLHSKDEYPGAGIGLALCQKVVEYHGGRIWTEPAEGGGTVFRFTLPAVGAPA